MAAMEQALDTIESQHKLRRQGILGCILILAAIGSWLIVNAFSAPHAQDHSTTEEPATSAEHAAEDSHADEDSHAAEEHDAAHREGDDHSGHPAAEAPSVFSVFPFIALLLCIAILPLSAKTEHWWENNWNRLKVAAGLGVLTLIYYGFMYGHGVHDHMTGGVSGPGAAAAAVVLSNALLVEYIPFITLLFSLYVISGGIVIESRLMGKPHVNAGIIALGALLASFVGTTGAAMLLIRPLLVANVKRNHVVHTVVFFIFAVCNTGGCLLPIGDPPLFLGYLRGVPFLWTLKLWPMWLFANILIVAVYFIWDSIISKKEDSDAFTSSNPDDPAFRMLGKLNLLWLVGIILCVAMLDPNKPFPGTDWHAPLYFREFLMFGLTTCSLVFTTEVIRL
ncbi:MAG: sodium:proton antiporter [Planctomycetaceae bacterium]|nr:sodium:proton antiporter [Planctomycetaceae bacterium]